LVATEQSARTLWDDADPAAWRRAATDWRGMFAESESERRGSRADLAEELGYASVSKLGDVIGQWRRLRADALAGNDEAAERVRRAEDFGQMIAARHPHALTYVREEGVQ
jgi:hypothetical protein